MKKLLQISVLSASILALVGCGGGGSDSSSSSATYAIGGTLSGLGSGNSVELLLNGGAPLPLNSDGTFVFGSKVAANGSYAVTVGAQPTGQICTVNNGTGSGVNANITNVSVTCSVTTFTIAGSVSGLGNGSQLLLQNNSADPTTISANGSFSFSTPVSYNGSYTVTVATQPTGQTCTVSNGTGSGVTSNITQVSVTCTNNTYTVSGSVTGLGSGGQVTLQNNSADPITVNGNSLFTFPTPIAYNGSYNVTVGTQPTGRTCSVNNGTGSGVVSDISDVAIVCTTNTYSIGGTLSGLKTGLQVTLQNNGSDPVTVNANGTFTMPTSVAYGGSYSISIGSQPIGQVCTATNNAGSVTSTVSDIVISCVNKQGKFAYVANFNSGTISLFQMNNSTGGLTPLSPATINSGDHPSSVATHPNGKFLYVANGAFNPAVLFAYRVNPLTGIPLLVGQYSLGNDGSYSVTVDPLGRYVYLADAAGGVASYSINQTSGALTQIGIYPTSSGGFPTAVTADPYGKFVYVLNQTTNNISAYLVNQSTGALSAIGTYATGAGGYGIVIDPSGKYLYTSSVRFGKSVQAYTINASTGALTFMAGYGDGSATDNVTISPTGEFLYNVGSANVIAYARNQSTGVLTPVGTYATGGSGGNAMAIDPLNKFAYIPNKGSDYIGNVSVMSINQSSGSLTALSPVATGNYNVSVAIAVEQ